MASTLEALTELTTRNSDLRDRCTKLAYNSHDPYFRIMLTQLPRVESSRRDTYTDWKIVLESSAISLRERLVLAIHFLDDAAMSSYLRWVVKHSSLAGDINCLLVTGLTRSGLNIVQRYVDRTGDIQTATILSSYVCPGRYTDPRAKQWLDVYRSFLDGMKMFHCRVQFDVERGEYLQMLADGGARIVWNEWAPPQSLIRCNYCAKTINSPSTTAAYTSVSTSATV